MPNQSILIKPASGYCNMNCKYCFYYDVIDKREIRNYGFMSHETLENLVRKGIEYADDMVTFAFQGGEPTLAGLPFYEKLIEYVNKYNTNNIKVNYAIQTNGLVVDEAWAKFFHDHKFLVGLSLDGPKDIHDMNRIDQKEKGTFNRISQTAKVLTKHKVDFNILTVVSKAVAKHPLKIYSFFRKNGFRFMQFIPCLDELGEEPGSKKHSLLPDDYGDFLCKLFDAWYKDFMKGDGCSIRMFDNILTMMLGYPPESCDMVGSCSVNVVVEGDGSAYPCDFYVLDEWCLGNINENSFEEIRTNPLGAKFVEISRQLDDECKTCEFYGICRGGCRRHKEPIIQEKLSKNYFCESYKTFYKYTLPRFQEVATIIRRQPTR